MINYTLSQPCEFQYTINIATSSQQTLNDKSAYLGLTVEFECWHFIHNLPLCWHWTPNHLRDPFILGWRSIVNPTIVFLSALRWSLDPACATSKLAELLTDQTLNLIRLLPCSRYVASCLNRTKWRKTIHRRTISGMRIAHVYIIPKFPYDDVRHCIIDLALMQCIDRRKM